MKAVIIYLAGKVPKSDEELKNYRDWRKDFEAIVKKASASEIICLDPSRVHFDISDIYGIFGRDVYLIKSSDFVVVDARGRIGPGTAQEMLIAKYFMKPVITILPRNSHYWKDTKIRDKGAKAWMNPFIAATSDAIAETVEEAAKMVGCSANNGAGITAKGIRLLDRAAEYYAERVMHKDGGAKTVHLKSDGLRIVLASKSRGREKILREAGVDFEIMPSDIDESKIRDLNPEALAKKLALAKAENIAAKVSGDKVVIGVDTMGVISGKIIEKPKDRSDAIRMLEELSGRTHEVFTGIAVLCCKNKKSLVDISKAKVTFRKLSRAEIEDYLKTDDALRFAGGYNIDGTKSMKFIESIRGSYSGIIGMPLEKLIPMLRKCGIDV